VPPVFANMLQQMQPGQITEPVRGQSGFQIVQMIEKRGAQQQMVTQYRASDIMVRTSDLVNAEAARQKAAAEAEIANLSSKAKEVLRAQVAGLAVKGAEKILGREIDANRHRDLLDQVAGEI